MCYAYPVFKVPSGISSAKYILQFQFHLASYSCVSCYFYHCILVFFLLYTNVNKSSFSCLFSLNSHNSNAVVYCFFATDLMMPDAAFSSDAAFSFLQYPFSLMHLSLCSDLECDTFQKRTFCQLSKFLKRLKPPSLVIITALYCCSGTAGNDYWGRRLGDFLYF